MDSDRQAGMALSREFSRRNVLAAGAAALAAAATLGEPSLAQTVSEPETGKALVLSGGGAKGAFELGAITYLYEAGIKPDIICGTSVGALNAAKLAEGPDGLAGLESLWSSMRNNADMFINSDWLSEIDQDFAGILMGATSSSSVQSGYNSGITFLSSLINALPVLLGRGTGLLASTQVVFTRAVSLYDAEPIRVKIDANLDANKIASWGDQGNQLWISMVDLNTGLLRYVNAKGQVFERDCKTPVTSQPAQLCQQEAASVQAAQDVLNILNNTPTSEIPGGEQDHRGLLRASRNKLQNAQAAYQTCMANATSTAGAQQIVVDIHDAVKASASSPPAFSPWPCAGGLYVDGGVRTLLPLEPALAAGARDVYAVVAGVVAPSTELNGGRLLDVVSRSIDLLSSEIGYRDSLRPSNLQSFYLVMPDVEIHDTNVIDPGLIQINRDYGYMRMADVLNRVDPTEQQARFGLSTAVAAKRKAIWQLENRRAGQPDPSDPSAPVSAGGDPGLDAAIQQGKQDLKEMLNQRRASGDPIPPDIDTWTQSPERHSWLS
jgi:predicted acylesterase/phospholipase RssA